MAPVVPLRLRRATDEEIAAAWKILHDNPDPVEPKRIRTKKKKRPKNAPKHVAGARAVEQIRSRRRSRAA